MKATPVPEVSPILPNTIDCILTAVPRSLDISFNLRYIIALGLFQDLNTASTASISCFLGSCGKSSPTSFLYIFLYSSTIDFK